MSDLPPSVRLKDHHVKAGGLLQWHRRANGEWWALVEIVEDAPGFRGGLEPPREVWLPEHQVEKVHGEDYRRVKATRD
ncbi:hypothetical protein [Nonomuraea sp. KM90]|uniref:hypothetical protein n=1 Tax=Nonomuraea sp. KM90 TaxID=3457428 RepID=UPI003FCCBA19